MPFIQGHDEVAQIVVRCLPCLALPCLALHCIALLDKDHAVAFLLHAQGRIQKQSVVIERCLLARWNVWSCKHCDGHLCWTVRVHVNARLSPSADSSMTWYLHAASLQDGKPAIHAALLARNSEWGSQFSQQHRLAEQHTQSCS